MVNCCLNHLRDKYGVPNSNSRAERKCSVNLNLGEHVQCELMLFPTFPTYVLIYNH